MKYLIILFAFIGLIGCRTSPVVISLPFESTPIPATPKYDLLESWASHPDKKDQADSLPMHAGLSDHQSTAKADVFFVHPTIFYNKPENQYQWNADINDIEMNNRVDNSTILLQANVFNGSCRVFAPRYRQAHYYSFFTPQKEYGAQALSMAYKDVKAAFEYYMDHYNNGRPIVIASHSQGTVHTVKLLQEYFDGKPLQKQLVTAYLVGIAVPESRFKNLKPSSKPDEIGTYACWNTFGRNFIPEWYENGLKYSVCTNPLSWSSANNTEVGYEQNLGGLDPKLKILPKVCNAITKDGLLWIDRPRVKGAALVKNKVWHKADINFFWMNIRENVETRVNLFLTKN